VEIHFIQRKQSNETNVTSHTFQQISYLNIFAECFRGPLKTLYRPHAARGPVVGPHRNRGLKHYILYCLENDNFKTAEISPVFT